MPKSAIISDADGPAGTALLEHLVSRTSSDGWDRILVNSRSGKRRISDARLFYVQLDFSERPGALIEQMVESCSDITHAYFCSVAQEDTLEASNKSNAALFENFLLALTCSAPRLENCTLLQAGSRYYGSHICPVPTPCREDDPRRGDATDNFHHAQENFLQTLQMNQQWTWNVVRSDAIISSVPDPMGLDTALCLAMYFLVTRELAVEAKMPSNQRYWNGTDGVSDAALLAEFLTWVSTNPECVNEAFNFSNGDHFTWRFMWPRLAEYFGAYATPDQIFSLAEPDVGALQQELSLEDWSKDKKLVWDKLCDEAGLPEAKSTFEVNSWASQDGVFSRSWTATLSMNKARRYGWIGFADSFDCCVQAFETLREKRCIP